MQEDNSEARGSSECDFCGKFLDEEHARRRFCSEECKQDAGGPDFPLTSRQCGRCGEVFSPTHWGQRYCGKACRQQPNRTVQWRRDQETCSNCGTWFQPGTHNQKYCSTQCASEVQLLGKQLAATQTDSADCFGCGTPFFPTGPQQRYCSPECRRRTKLETQNRPKSTVASSEFAAGELRHNAKGHDVPTMPLDDYGFPAFRFRNEREFHNWFNISFPLFGIRRLRRSDGRFPDVSCETVNGEILHIELEFLSPRFRDHRGQLGSVHAVLCAVRRPQDRTLFGIPVFGLTVADFSGDTFDRKTQRISPEAALMFRSNLRFFIDDEIL